MTVTESLPETLFLHRGHHVGLHHARQHRRRRARKPQQGIFPIYARYVSTTMSGEDVDGTKYDVPDVPWVNYFNGGDAVHGYPRESYGFPQSNGCVELPIEAAHTVFGMLAIGDIVVGAVERLAPAPARRQRYLTVSVPSIPAMRCPGTEQKNLYVPALRSSVRSFVPPWKVGVAPTILPEEDSIVML